MYATPSPIPALSSLTPKKNITPIKTRINPPMTSLGMYIALDNSELKPKPTIIWRDPNIKYSSPPINPKDILFLFLELVTILTPYLITPLIIMAHNPIGALPGK